MSKFYPIPSYEGLYWIDFEGHVKNREDHLMKPIQTSKGLMVELRKNGQREKLFIDDLITIIKTLEELK